MATFGTSSTPSPTLNALSVGLGFNRPPCAKGWRRWLRKLKRGVDTNRSMNNSYHVQVRGGFEASHAERTIRIPFTIRASRSARRDSDLLWSATRCSGNSHPVGRNPGWRFYTLCTPRHPRLERGREIDNEPISLGVPEISATPRRRIGKQAEKHGGWIEEPARLKRLHSTESNVVSRAFVMAVGFRLVKVCRRTPKAPNAVPSVRPSARQQTPAWGLLSATDANPPCVASAEQST